jgi:hypothetical protein
MFIGLCGKFDVRFFPHDICVYPCSGGSALLPLATTIDIKHIYLDIFSIFSIFILYLYSIIFDSIYIRKETSRYHKFIF